MGERPVSRRVALCRTPGMGKCERGASPPNSCRLLREEPLHMRRPGQNRVESGMAALGLAGSVSGRSFSVSRLAATRSNIGHSLAPKPTLNADEYSPKRQPTQLWMAELTLSSTDKRFYARVHLLGHANGRNTVAANSGKGRVATVAERLAFNCLVRRGRGLCRSRSGWQLSMASAGNVRFEF